MKTNTINALILLMFCIGSAIAQPPPPPPTPCPHPPCPLMISSVRGKANENAIKSDSVFREMDSQSDYRRSQVYEAIERRRGYSK